MLKSGCRFLSPLSTTAVPVIRRYSELCEG